MDSKNSIKMKPMDLSERKSLKAKENSSRAQESK
jgi:hypothetical protein